MLEIFRKNVFVNSLAILFYIVVLHLAPFLKTSTIGPEASGILTGLIFNWFGKYSLTLNILQIPLLFLQAVYINRLFNIHRLNQPPHLFPGLFYVLVMSFGLRFSSFNGILLANSFLIIAWFELFVQSRNDKVDMHTFNMGLAIGLASLFYAPTIFTLVAAIIGLITIRTVRSADYYRLLLGVGIPYYLLAAVLFVTDNAALWRRLHLGDDWQFIWQFGIPLQSVLILCLMIICFLIVAAQANRLGKGYNIHVRRKVLSLWWWLGLTGLLAFVGPVEPNLHWQILALPLAVLLGLSMYILENKTAAEILHIVLLGSALVLQFLF